MEFPGVLGVALWRLKNAIQAWPIAALGPFFAVVAADIAVDLDNGRLGAVGMEIIVAPLIAVAVLNVVARDQAGISGPLMFVLGTVSGLGASALLTRGITTGSPDIFLIGLRHFTVMAYAWASIASEPPVKRRAEFAFVAS